MEARRCVVVTTQHLPSRCATMHCVRDRAPNKTTLVDTRVSDTNVIGHEHEFGFRHHDPQTLSASGRATRPLPTILSIAWHCVGDVCWKKCADVSNS